MQSKHSQDYYYNQVNSLTTIPSLPLIASELMALTREDNLSVQQLLPVIEKDPPLAMKVLKVANSAYYGLRQKVESLRHALVIIGMKQLSDLSLGFSVMTTLTDDDHGSELEWDKLWEHSAAVGHIAQLLQNSLGVQTGSSPYALGLLHDIGKIILFRLEPIKYVEVIKDALKNETSTQAVEIEHLGIDHMTVGGWVAEKWQLPPSIYNAIKHHHSPDLVDEPEMRVSTALVQMANIVANLRSLSFGKSYQRSILRDEPGWLILKDVSQNLEDLDFERFVMSIQDEVDTILETVGLMGGK